MDIIIDNEINLFRFFSKQFVSIWFRLKNFMPKILLNFFKMQNKKQLLCENADIEVVSNQEENVILRKMCGLCA